LEKKKISVKETDIWAFVEGTDKGSWRVDFFGMVVSKLFRSLFPKEFVEDVKRIDDGVTETIILLRTKFPGGLGKIRKLLNDNPDDSFLTSKGFEKIFKKELKEIFKTCEDQNIRDISENIICNIAWVPDFFRRKIKNASELKAKLKGLAGQNLEPGNILKSFREKIVQNRDISVYEFFILSLEENKKFTEIFSESIKEYAKTFDKTFKNDREFKTEFGKALDISVNVIPRKFFEEFNKLAFGEPVKQEKCSVYKWNFSPILGNGEYNIYKAYKIFARKEHSHLLIGTELDWLKNNEAAWPHLRLDPAAENLNFYKEGMPVPLAFETLKEQNQDIFNGINAGHFLYRREKNEEEEQKNRRKGFLDACHIFPVPDWDVSPCVLYYCFYFSAMDSGESKDREALCKKFFKDMLTKNIDGFLKDTLTKNIAVFLDYAKKKLKDEQYNEVNDRLKECDFFKGAELKKSENDYRKLIVIENTARTVPRKPGNVYEPTSPEKLIWQIAGQWQAHIGQMLSKKAFNRKNENYDPKFSEAEKSDIENWAQDIRFFLERDGEVIVDEHTRYDSENFYKPWKKLRPRSRYKTLLKDIYQIVHSAKNQELAWITEKPATKGGKWIGPTILNNINELWKKATLVERLCGKKTREEYHQDNSLDAVTKRRLEEIVGEMTEKEKAGKELKKEEKDRCGAKLFEIVRDSIDTGRKAKPQADLYWPYFCAIFGYDENDSEIREIFCEEIIAIGKDIKRREKKTEKTHEKE
jgi:hypothetical protein